MKKLFFICILFSISCTTNIHRLADNDKTEAYEAIKNLKENALLWVYETEFKKEEILEGIVAKNPNNFQVQNRLDDLRFERSTNYEDLVASLKEHYTFSDVYLIPDSLFEKFHSSQVPAMDLEGNSFMKDEFNFSGINCITPEVNKIYLKKGPDPIPAPFPSLIQGSNSILHNIFSKQTQSNKLVKKLNKVLINFEKEASEYN